MSVGLFRSQAQEVIVMQLVKWDTSNMPPNCPVHIPHPRSLHLLLPQPTAIMDADRDELNERAQLAEQAERYQDMVAHMKTLAGKYSPLETEERNRLSVAYKNVVGALRSAWRVLSSIESKNPDRCVTDYKGEISEQLREICLEVLVRINDCTICL